MPLLPLLRRAKSSHCKPCKAFAKKYIKIAEHMKDTVFLGEQPDWGLNGGLWVAVVARGGPWPWPAPAPAPVPCALAQLETVVRHALTALDDPTHPPLPALGGVMMCTRSHNGRRER